MENVFVFIGTLLCVSMGEARPALRQLEHGDHNLCKILRAPDNGRLEFPPKYESGSWIVLWCPIGGNTTRTFLQNGTLDDILRKRIGFQHGNDKFNGEESKVEDISNSTVNTDRGNNANTCIMPRIPQYGRMDYPDNIAHFSPGTKVTYSCNDGYALRGQSSRECLPTGQWNGPPPDCQVNSCKPPVTHVHGGVVIQLQADQIYTTDTEITHICKDGFEMKGDSKQRCLNNGLWSGEVPDCIEKKWYKNPSIWTTIALGVSNIITIVLFIRRRVQNTTTNNEEAETKEVDTQTDSVSEAKSAESGPCESEESDSTEQNTTTNNEEAETKEVDTQTDSVSEAKSAESGPCESEESDDIRKEEKVISLRKHADKMLPEGDASVSNNGIMESSIPITNDNRASMTSPNKEENEPKQATDIEAIQIGNTSMMPTEPDDDSKPLIDPNTMPDKTPDLPRTIENCYRHVNTLPRDSTVPDDDDDDDTPLSELQPLSEQQRLIRRLPDRPTHLSAEEYVHVDNAEETGD